MTLPDNSDTPELDNLRLKVEDFKAWAATLPEHKAEWESNYYYWSDIYDAVGRFLEKVPLAEWTPEAYDLLLYALARDNEAEYVLDSLKEYPEQLIALASKAFTYQDWQARWQLAYGLSQLKDYKDVAEKLLLQFINDEHEYVRRRASLALEDMQS